MKCPDCLNKHKCEDCGKDFILPQVKAVPQLKYDQPGKCCCQCYKNIQSTFGCGCFCHKKKHSS